MMEELWSQYYKRAVALYENYNFEAALKVSQKCLKISIKTYGKKSKEYLRTLYLMANILNKSGKYYEALSAFNEVKSIYQSSGGYDIKQDVLLKIENNIKELEEKIEESRLSENLDEKEEQRDIQPNSEGEESDEQKKDYSMEGPKESKINLRQGKIYCGYCGNTVASIATICPACGVQVGTGNRFCPLCGNPRRSLLAVFCTYCGVDFRQLGEEYLHLLFGPMLCKLL